jgi:hypothetical protein
VAGGVERWGLGGGADVGIETTERKGSVEEVPFFSGWRVIVNEGFVARLWWSADVRGSMW